jgi:hypothetical protein
MSASISPTVPASDNGCGAVGGMIGRGNRSTGEKPVLTSLRRPQIPNELRWN